MSCSLKKKKKENCVIVCALEDEKKYPERRCSKPIYC